MLGTDKMQRFVRLLPGRIRIEVCGLLRNPAAASKLRLELEPVKGVTKVEPCIATGRLLIVYNDRAVSADTLLRLIVGLEQPALKLESDGTTPPKDAALSSRTVTAAPQEAAVASTEADGPDSRAQAPGESSGLIRGVGALAEAAATAETDTSGRAADADGFVPGHGMEPTPSDSPAPSRTMPQAAAGPHDGVGDGGTATQPIGDSPAASRAMPQAAAGPRDGAGDGGTAIPPPSDSPAPSRTMPQAAAGPHDGAGNGGTAIPPPSDSPAASRTMPQAASRPQDRAGTGAAAVPLAGDIAAAIRTMPRPSDARNSPHPSAAPAPGASAAAPPLPLTLAMGGLAVLGVKRLLFGQSALAQSPLPFYLSGMLAVVTGYPFLRRGIAEFGREKRINTDLMIGTGALALALIRENVVVLAGMAILQYVNWKRARLRMEDQPPVELPPEIRRYGDTAGKLGIAAAAATWALTRDPLRGIAVLLAANPRPAILPAETAWSQAAVAMKERGIPLPQHASIGSTRGQATLLLEDTALLTASQVQQTGITARDGEPERVVCAAASLMDKTSHSWKDAVREEARRTCRTLRTAFHVEETEGGISGTIQDTRYAVGTLPYCQRAGISCESYYLEAKRLQKQGFDVLFVAMETKTGPVCQGLLYRKPQIPDETRQLLGQLSGSGFNVLPLRDGAGIGQEQLAELGMQAGWLGLTEGELIERIAAMHQSGEEAHLVIGPEEPGAAARYLMEAGVPSLRLNELEPLLITASEGIREVESAVQEHFRATKRWNLAGSVLAALGVIGAPLANLASDALSLAFVSRSQRIAQTAFERQPVLGAESGSVSAQSEIAAAVEPLHWHAAPWERVAGTLRVNERAGLSTERVREAKERFGSNELQQRERTPWHVTYLGQFKEFTTLVLLGTSVLAFFTGGAFDALAMGAVLLANAAIGTYQERRAEQVLESLNRFQPPDATVIRDGQESRVSARELVPGDIVRMEAGDRVPADLRIVNAWNLEVNESALTGESLPVPKREAPVMADSPLSERSNMLYMGTDVCRGKALGVVVQTGMGTEIGHLMSLLKNDEKEITPLQRKVTGISKTFLKWALLAGGAVFAAGLLRGVPLSQMVTSSITLAASAIPEGLPVTITIALSAGIFRMAKKKVLVRKLSALETLGRTTVVCSDKTGTLTKNEMTVTAIASASRQWTVTGTGYEPAGVIESACKGRDDVQHPDLQRLIQIAVLCNNSKLRQEDGQWTVQGDPTEGALLSMAAKAGVQPERLSAWRRAEEVPFDSATATMRVVCTDSDAGEACFAFAKGAVESILHQCDFYQEDGEVRPLTEDIRACILKQNEAYAAEALRVLALAYRPVEPGTAAPADGGGFIYAGMAGMIDPPKPGVQISIREALALGVRPIMITGDHPVTAAAVAKQVGICSGSGQCRVIAGPELDTLTEAELDKAVEHVSVFARVTPEHKLRIVKALQNRGHVVAMTGDGVNDSPAIKQANVGIAMGRMGTEVTKETADIVLQEDGFGSIVDGVKEGRTIIGSIRKALGCLLTGNLAEILVTSAAVMIGLPMPLVPIQILLMNLLTDALPAMVLAVNAGNNKMQTERIDIVDKSLYRKVVTRGVLLGIGSLGLFAWTLASGAPVATAQSVAFATLVAGQLFQTLSWRSEGTGETIRDAGRDKFMLGALGVSALALLTTLYVPAVARIFHTAPLTAAQWLPILLVAGSVSLLAKPILAMLGGESLLCSRTSNASLSAPL